MYLFDGSRSFFHPFCTTAKYVFILSWPGETASEQCLNVVSIAESIWNDNLNFQKAEKALKYYKGFKGQSEKEETALNYEFERLKMIAMKQKLNNKFQMSDVCE